MSAERAETPTLDVIGAYVDRRIREALESRDRMILGDEAYDRLLAHFKEEVPA